MARRQPGYLIEEADNAAWRRKPCRCLQNNDLTIARVLLSSVNDAHELVGHLPVDGVEVLHVVHGDDCDAVLHGVDKL